MSPTYTMSAHLCKQIYASWRQSHYAQDAQPEKQQRPEASSSASASTTAGNAFYYPISPSALPNYKPTYLHRPPLPTSTQKRSMESDRGSDSGE